MINVQSSMSKLKGIFCMYAYIYRESRAGEGRYSVTISSWKERLDHAEEKEVVLTGERLDHAEEKGARGDKLMPGVRLPVLAGS